MPPLVLIERNRIPISMALLLLAWLSPLFSLAVHFGIIAICALLILAALLLSRPTPVPAGSFPLRPASYKLLMTAVVATLVFSFINRFMQISDLDTSGMALPLITVLVLIAPLRRAGLSEDADA